jgi:hypothetical protein
MISQKISENNLLREKFRKIWEQYTEEVGFLYPKNRKSY